MKLICIKASRADGAFCIRWATSDAGAGSARKEMSTGGYKRADMVTREFELKKITKSDFVEFLNANHLS